MSYPDELAGKQVSCPYCGTVAQVPAPQKTATPAQQQLGVYTLVGKIGEGGTGVEAVIRKMAAKEPEKRYQDHDSLLSDLGKAKSGQPPAAIAETIRDRPAAPAPSAQRTARGGRPETNRAAKA